MGLNTFVMGTDLHPGAVYQLHVDTGGDSHPDIIFDGVFSAIENGTQTVTVTVTHAIGAQKPGHWTSSVT